MYLLQTILVCSLFYGTIKCEVPQYRPVPVPKCCRPEEILIGSMCTRVNGTSRWYPKFTSKEGLSNIPVDYSLVIGRPNCGHMQLWPIYHYESSADKLRLLPNGILRHYYDNQVPNEFEYESGESLQDTGLFHDYEFGKFCLDKKIDGIESEFAWVCMPDHTQLWTTNEFLMRNIVNPIAHGITIICLLAIAIIYFVMPTLRDLAGNIITTISMCLILSQIADLVRLLTVFKSHISLLIAEAFCYMSLLGAFFWLNSLGFYIWRTFKNVFLRITDGKKYCYYGAYAWSCTVVLGCLAMFAHFTMDYPDLSSMKASDKTREQIGSLGMIIFFVPVAFTIIADVIFFANTLKKLNRMHTYGRIHHKLRHSFRMFVLLLLTMTLGWLFFLSSFSKYEGLINSHIVVNALLGPLMFYICVINQKHVSYLLKKTCCYENCFCPCCRPDNGSEWGDEMTAMNTDLNGEITNLKFITV
ncbi:probable G-protein coupled receptor Mth-like 5 isoform X2 [Anthonomus grandis grandis]|uniref:probable G-protein coupled receptor Mth-like 5 isoform X2 n=1 Tax=Anthonomus grandis grandis TaxID=2921223 RepID=UPI002165DAA0|nr:probable G-protein coupled receptor Mth-like 5 isoform X2 [Anthonomus grandis grandis]